MIARFSLAGALAATLAACEAPSPVDTPAAGNAQAQQIQITNDFHNQLIRMQPVYQRLAIKRAVMASGYRCGRLDNTGFQQDYRNMKMWIGHCEPEHRNYAVFLAPNGDVQVRNCTDAGTLSLPPCNDLPPATDDGAPGGATRNGAGNGSNNATP